MQRPLCVDLDGTLILTDSLYESLLFLFKKNIFLLFRAFYILALRGKSHFKAYVSDHAVLDPKFLPYNKALIDWLRHEKSTGRPLFLVTAGFEKTAHSIASYLDLFDGVWGSTLELNLKGVNKAQLLQQKFGINQYDYVGDHGADLPVWKNAENSIVVNASAHTLKKVVGIAKVSKIFPRKPFTLHDFFKVIRVHQYVKNLLIFVPIILAQQFFNTVVVEKTFLGFVSFCFLASSVYVLNDLLDLDSDRQHVNKSRRALASGSLSIPLGLLITVLFFVIAWVFAAQLPLKFCLVLAIYYALSFCYSFYLKSIILVDVCVLAGLYTIRILAGMILLPVASSGWIVEFSVFIFLSLAFVKRYAELKCKKDQGELKATGRGYHVEHINLILVFGIASGYISALIMALYLNSPQALVYYTRPEFLWIICPLLVYWISRIWLFASEGKMHDDPIIFALKDGASYIIACLIILSGLLAKYI